MALKSIYDLTGVKGKRNISYSQYSMYDQCPKRWKINYMDGNKEFTPNIHTTFGTAFHETLQSYLGIMYEDSAKAADELDLPKLLKDFIAKEYRKNMAITGGKQFTTQSDMVEFLYDGIDILEYFVKKRGAYFSKRGTKLIGIEMPIKVPMECNENVIMKGFIDIVMYDERTDRYKIYDIKTSTRGWNKWQKADKNKTSQMVLYKTYFAKQYNIDVEKIDLEYFIVRRKIAHDTEWPMKRIQTFVPASGKPTRNKLDKSIEAFVANCFNEDGSYNTEGNFPAVAGKNNKHCKYCDFRTDENLCKKAERILEN